MLRRSYSRPEMGYHYRPGVVERTGGSYDLAGIWRPVTYGPHTFHFNNEAYDRNLHSFYYNLEDDYYGAYGDLLEFEAALRMNRQLSEEERLRRWRMRLAFEELEEAQRLRNYSSMAETDRLALGLSNRSWWGERYGNQPYDYRPNWRSRFGNKMRRWDSSYLPLSSTLASRFAPVWGGSFDHLAGNERLLDSQLHQAQNEIFRDRLFDSERRLNHDLRQQELGSIGRSLAHQRSNLRDRLENNILHNQERALENRFMNDAVYDHELQRRLEGKRSLAHQESYLRDRLEDNVLDNQERALETRLLSDAVYDRELHRHLDRRNEEMIYDQERMFENRLENEALDRASQQLDDNGRYFQAADVVDSELRDRSGYDYHNYSDYVPGDLLEDDVGSDFERDRCQRDLMY